MLFPLILFCAAVFESSSSVVYVSSSIGSDSNSGISEKSPVRSLQHAIALTTSLKSNTIRAEGNFILSETIQLNVKQSGLMIDKWEGRQRPVISGGINIPPLKWKLEGAIWSVVLPGEVFGAVLNNTSTIFVNGHRRMIVRTPMKHWNQSLVTGKKTGA